MNLWDVLLSGGVLFGLFVIAYCRITGRTLVEFFMEMKEIFSSNTEEVRI